MSGVRPAARLPGPPGLLPGPPDAVIDLQSAAGAALVGAQWRYAEATVTQVRFHGVGADLGPTGEPNEAHDVVPHAEGTDFDDTHWCVLAPEDTDRRLGAGRVSFLWYRLAVTIPERIADFDPTGATVVFEIVVDDYAEVWVNGTLPLALGATGGNVVSGFNAPNRVLLTRDARPGQRFQIAVLGINGPISASPRNFIWVRTATLDLYAAARASSAFPAPIRVHRADERLDTLVPASPALEQVAGGFDSVAGCVWTRDGALLFASPSMNTIYRWAPDTGAVTVFRPKAGYAGTDIGRHPEPGASGLTLDPQGRLVICQHGNRRVIRVEPRGNVTVLADRHLGRRLNSPGDLVYRSDGTLYFTDPPFGLPGSFDDPKKETPDSGVYRVRDRGVDLLVDELAAPSGIALSPDERNFYVRNGDPAVVMRYEMDDAGGLSNGQVLIDMTSAPRGDDVAAAGIKVDVDGNVYVCGAGGIWIVSPDGARLGVLELPETPRNLAWGGADAKTLYVTATTGVYRIRLDIPGIRP